jgi:hypothetical protein
LMDAIVDFFNANEMPFRAIRDGDVIITDA